MNEPITNPLPKTNLKKSDFYYELPPELIANTPVTPRDSSRLMYLNRETGEVSHSIFHNIGEFLRSGDTLVINESKVVPARINGTSSRGGDIELLLLRRSQDDPDTWECLAGPGKHAKPGDTLTFGERSLIGNVKSITDGGCRIVSFSYDKNKYHDILAVLDEVGVMPLPPYIKEKLTDKNRYQTVYATVEGSAAAPTAGLHFTEELMKSLEASGIVFARALLHIGLGTFRPVREENIADHVMHTEYFSVSPEMAELINSRRRAGGRIICVGTTSCRVLESVADDDGIVHPMLGETGIFIYPDYRFKVTDGLITNFHLPESTLIMLVSAFAGRENTLNAYEIAIREKYRFYSFGDAMIVL